MPAAQCEAVDWANGAKDGMFASGGAWERVSITGLGGRRRLADTGGPEAKAPGSAQLSINHCDLGQITEKRRRPYTLLCTKNQASYQQRGQQRRRDLEHLARLEGETGETAPATEAARGPWDGTRSASAE